MKFKKGDKVYMPHRNFKVWTIVDTANSDRVNANFPIVLTISNTDERKHRLNPNGGLCTGDSNPLIFHANQKNYELLSQLYDGDFEKPPVTGSELTEKLQNDQTTN